jgi:hypothetical protein
MPQLTPVITHIGVEVPTATDPAQGYWPTPGRPFVRGRFVPLTVAASGAILVSSSEATTTYFVTTPGLVRAGPLRLCCFSLTGVGANDAWVF